MPVLLGSHLDLPDTLYAWARYIEGEPYLIHFSGMKGDGSVVEWLWLFPHQDQAIRAKALGRFTHIPGVEKMAAIVESTLPPGDSGIYLQKVPLRWLATDWNSHLDDFAEIWVGFDFLNYAGHRSIEAATAIVSVRDFKRALFLRD
jgi:hypothetical protein